MRKVINFIRKISQGFKFSYMRFLILHLEDPQGDNTIVLARLKNALHEISCVK